MNNLLIITTTVENKEDAERLTALLLEQRLVACAQISAPITSIYRWQGKVCTATEYTLALKTLRQHYPIIKEIILREHPYETPEIIAQEITMISESYAHWLQQEVS